jgi:hypothetical protein
MRFINHKGKMHPNGNFGQWVSLNPTNICSRKLLQLALCLGKVQADLGALLAPPTSVRSRANSAHAFQEIFRIEKEPVWRAIYHTTRVRVPSRACRRVWAIKPNSRHITQGTNSFIAQIGPV